MYRFLRPAAFAAAVIALLAAQTSPGRAQTEDKLFGLWLYSCEEGPCQAFFELEAPNGSKAVGMGMIQGEKPADTTLIVIAPVGVALPPGVRLEVGDLAPASLPFQYCDDNGCTSFIQLSAEMIEALSTAETVTVSYFIYGSFDPIAYSVPITGFAEARAQLIEPR